MILVVYGLVMILFVYISFFFFSRRRRHTRCASVTGVQTCALPIFLPNLRVVWQPNERTLFWSAVSRAVRTPSRIDRQLQALPVLAPATDFESETLTAIEAGYRGQPADSTNLSVSVFYNIYGDRRTTEFAPGGMLPIRLANSLKGHTYGIEAWATQQVAPWWRLNLGLATVAKDFEVKQGHVDLTDGESAGNDPDFRFLARSQMDLRDDVQLAIGFRAVDDLERPEVGGDRKSVV